MQHSRPGCEGTTTILVSLFVVIVFHSFIERERENRERERERERERMMMVWMARKTGKPHNEEPQIWVFRVFWLSHIYYY